MIGALMRAAEAAELASDCNQSMQVVAKADGLAVISRIETTDLGWSREFTIAWDEFEADPTKLPAMVRYEAALLQKRAQTVPVIKVAPAGEKPAVRLIERDDWSIIGAAVATLAFCVPLAAGIWP